MLKTADRTILMIYHKYRLSYLSFAAFNTGYSWMSSIKKESCLSVAMQKCIRGAALDNLAYKASRRNRRPFGRNLKDIVRVN